MPEQGSGLARAGFLILAGCTVVMAVFTLLLHRAAQRLGKDPQQSLRLASGFWGVATLCLLCFGLGWYRPDEPAGYGLLGFIGLAYVLARRCVQSVAKKEE
jgi:hypothetical protein